MYLVRARPVSNKPLRTHESLLTSWIVDIWSVGCILAECLGGKPIFRGRECVYSQSYTTTHHSRYLSYVDQLSQILNCLGTPKEDALRRVGSPRAQDYIRSLPIKPRIPFNSLYPHANPSAIDFLGQMLCFDPAQRISCEDALKHPYLQVWHDPNDEPVCEKVQPEPHMLDRCH